MARTDTLSNFLTDVAEAIREKKGTTDTISASSFDTEIASIESGGGNVDDYWDFSGLRNYGLLIEYIKTIPNFDASIYTSFNKMFQNFYGLKTLPVFDTSNVTNFSYAFQYCRNLDLSIIEKWDTSKATNMSYMFANLQGDIVDRIAPNMNTSNVTNAEGMFQYSWFYKIPKYDFGKVNRVNYMFSNGIYLEEFGGFENLGKAYLTSQSANYYQYTLELNSSNKLTHDSLMNVINNLYDIASAGVQTQKLVLGSTNLAKLTKEEIAIATNKGWSVS